MCQSLAPTDLTTLVRWAAEQRADHLTPFDGLFESLVEAAVANLADTGVTVELARFALSRFREHIAPGLHN